MYFPPNKERLSKIKGITDEDIGKTILFCPDCDWQYPLGTFGKPYCLECGERLHISIIDKDLIDLIKGG